MQINQFKKVKVNAKILSIYTKVTDRFQYEILEEDGSVIYSQEDGYVPAIMPGTHYGDYIILEIDLDTGVIVNWKKPSAEQIENLLKEE